MQIESLEQEVKDRDVEFKVVKCPLCHSEMTKIVWTDERYAKMVIDIVCMAFNVSNEDLRSRSRERNIVLARHIAIYYIKENTIFTLDRVGKKFNRGHADVIWAIGKFKNALIGNDPLMLSYINIVKDYIEAISVKCEVNLSLT